MIKNSKATYKVTSINLNEKLDTYLISSQDKFDPLGVTKGSV